MPTLLELLSHNNNISLKESGIKDGGGRGKRDPPLQFYVPLKETRKSSDQAGQYDEVETCHFF